MMMTNRKVHIIDKDPSVIDSISLLLQSADIEIHTHFSAEHFLKKLESPLPVCLVAEVNLPGISGLELLRRLKNRNMFIPTILIATHSDITTAVHSMRAGAIDFLEKPFIEHQLVNRIQQVLTAYSSKDHQ